MTKEQSQELREQGYTIIRNQINNKWLNLLSAAINTAFLEHRNIQLSNNNDIKSDGVALHVLLSSPIFTEFLQTLLENGFIQSGFGDYGWLTCV
jgi:hypothetical protein